MTIRFKILALAFVILIIFGVVVGISTWLQHQFTNQIVAITHYVVPLRTLIADFDVLTDEYELITLRCYDSLALPRMNWKIQGHERGKTPSE